MVIIILGLKVSLNFMLEANIVIFFILGRWCVGYRNNTGAKWNNRGTNVYFWSSVEKDDNAWRHRLNVTETGLTREDFAKANGLTVRCIKD